ncbi:hypothetical protein RvY_02584-1 [Ramazzottius varieornatus]|uniref:Uncharacterized protein n=1 Tax=Ramazzottius varieornatus TaxID=947166 RepID=A0A1D1UK90_RAMVA|nr:hypothetical protein RvY_02584-1 [Ramazzottius varieornatus]
MPGRGGTFRDCVKDIIVHKYDLSLLRKAIGLATNDEELTELTGIAVGYTGRFSKVNAMRVTVVRLNGLLQNSISKYVVGLKNLLEKGLAHNGPRFIPTCGGGPEASREGAVVVVPGSSSQPTQTGFPPRLITSPHQGIRNMSHTAPNGPAALGTNQQVNESKVFIPDIKGLGRLQVAHYFLKFGAVGNVQMDKKPPSAVVCILFPGTVRAVLENPFLTIRSEKIFTKPVTVNSNKYVSLMDMK